jgi:hypothetical protein
MAGMDVKTLSASSTANEDHTNCGRNTGLMPADDFG